MSLVIYGWSWCGWCKKATELAASKGYKYKFIDIEKNPDQAYYPDTGKKITSVPKIYMNGKLIGGYEDLQNMLSKNENIVVYE